MLIGLVRRVDRVRCAAMGKVGRNEPCPCGSGRKYKKCCLTSGGGGAPYTGADRGAALQRLLLPIHPDDIDDARARFWGKHLPLRDRCTDPVLLEMAEIALQFWLFFDELDGGLTLAEEILQHDRDLDDGERRYLEMGRKSFMRLYEVIGVEPGASLTLRDVLHGGEVRIRERAGSRSLHTWDLIAARVMARRAGAGARRLHAARGRSGGRAEASRRRAHRGARAHVRARPRGRVGRVRSHVSAATGVAPRGAELEGRAPAMDRAVLARTERGSDRRKGVTADVIVAARPPPAPFNLDGIRPLRGLVARVCGRELADA
jgi:hypothetical protein